MEIEPVLVTCPACWQQIELEVDPTVPDQRYVEDCPVCCRPMRVEAHVGEDGARADVSPGND